jgi:two-component system response regulator (stage 0 sporulation protein F)
MSMPGMGGIEIFEAMEELRPDLNVVIVSGFTEEERLRSLVAAGRIQFFSKPFSVDALVKALLKGRGDSSV